MFKNELVRKLFERTIFVLIGALVVYFVMEPLASWRERNEDATKIANEIPNAELLMEEMKYDEAVDLYLSIKSPLVRKYEPDAYAYACHQLGYAYTKIAPVDNSSVIIKDAITSLTEAMGVYEGLPNREKEVIAVKRDLGIANCCAGEYCDRNKYLPIAEELLSEVQEYFTINGSELDLALTKTYIAFLHYLKYDIERDEQHINTAKSLLLESANILKLDSDVGYSLNQFYLGIILTKLAEGENALSHTDEAIKAYRNSAVALHGRKYGLEKARAYINIGHAYLKLSGIQNRKYNLECALRYLEYNVSMLNQDTMCTYYGKTLNMIGYIYQELSAIGDTRSNLKKAEGRYEKALRIISVEKNPMLYANITYYMGKNCMLIYEYCAKEGNIGDAVYYIKRSRDELLAALEIYEIEGADYYCAETFTALADTYYFLSTVEGEYISSEEAIEYCRKARRVYDEMKNEEGLHCVKICQGKILYRMSISANMDEDMMSDCLMNAKILLDEVIPKLSMTGNERVYAEAHKLKGDIYWKLAEQLDNNNYIHESYDAYNCALWLYESKDYPKEYEEIIDSLNIIKIF